MRPLVRGGIVVLALASPAALPAQSDSLRADSTRATGRPPRYWRNFLAGAATSILAHEGGHIATALAYGKKVTFGFDKGRPTVYSGINAVKDPREQFVFSSMGLNVQAVMDEAILDAPHARGNAFERGVLAGGIGTALFYITIGRTGSVSDVDYMARTSSLSKAEISLIYGGIATMHIFRIRHDGHYANFFARPTTDGTSGLRLGIDVSPE